MATSQDPIFVFGISRRSGTNFVARLLERHPDCGLPAEPVKEDHLLRSARLLERYARSTSRRWPREWGDRESGRLDLERGLGVGLLSFINERTDASRAVTKTPYTDHLDLYPRLFPQARVVLVVRDGRSAVESLVTGFGFPFEKAVREWRRGARNILRFAAEAESRTDLRFRVVRYEDLVEDPQTTIRDLLRFLDLPAEDAHIATMRQVPVFGSSFFRTDDGSLSWEPRAKDESFRPTKRYATWSTARHGRFLALAGREQAALGYELSSVRARRLWQAYNTVAQLAFPVQLLGYQVRRYLRSIRNRVRARARRAATQST